jgi:hypothetical protein
MKLSLPCPLCSDEEMFSGNRNQLLSTPLGHNYAELTETWELQFTCFFGHEVIFELHQHKFQILFEMGLQALVEGYTREAVSNIASAIERFYEFSILVFCNKLEISHKTFESAWKQMKKLSERQLGAYHMLYIACFKHPTKYLDDGLVNLRNRVIHNGYIPSYGEALKYTEEVFEYMSSKIVELRENFKHNIQVVMQNKKSGKLRPTLISSTLLKVDGEFEQKTQIYELHRHLELICRIPPFLNQQSDNESKSNEYKDAYRKLQSSDS